MKQKKFHKVWSKLTDEELSWIYRICGNAPDPDKILNGLYTHELFKSKSELFAWITRQAIRQRTHPKKSKTISLEHIAEVQEGQQRKEILSNGNKRKAGVSQLQGIFPGGHGDIIQDDKWF